MAVQEYHTLMRYKDTDGNVHIFYPVTYAEDVVGQETAEKPKSFDVTLSMTGWLDRSQTVSNALLVAEGYDYIVAPTPDCKETYDRCQVWAADVTTDGQMVFRCGDYPTTDLTVRIMRIEVENG